MRRKILKSTFESNLLTVYPEGHIDSSNAAQFETETLAEIAKHSDCAVSLDCDKLEYISSAGLRVLLSCQKIMSKQGSMKVIHVSDLIKEIFEVTGFIDILTIE